MLLRHAARITFCSSVALLALVWFSVSGARPPVCGVATPPATLTIAPDTVLLDSIGDTASVAATIVNACGRTDSLIPVSFTVRDPAVATLTTSGVQQRMVTAVDTGATRLIASVQDILVDSISIAVAGADLPPDTLPPPDTTGVTYSLMDGESGTVIPPWQYLSTCPGCTAVSNVTTVAKHGTRSYKYEIQTAQGMGVHQNQTQSGGPNLISMGDPGGRYKSGWYSFYVYVDEGFSENNAWNMIIGWMTGVTGAPNPISHIELRTLNGVLQLHYVLKNCAVGNYTCPNLPGMIQGGPGYYFMTASAPNGITAMPRDQWVHVAVYYKLAVTNGEVEVWQDGVKIMDLTASTMNTAYGHASPLTGNPGYCFCNPDMNIYLQFGIYGQYKTTLARMYVDDFRVSDYRPVP